MRVTKSHRPKEALSAAAGIVVGSKGGAEETEKEGGGFEGLCNELEDGKGLRIVLCDGDVVVWSGREGHSSRCEGVKSLHEMRDYIATIFGST